MTNFSAVVTDAGGGEVRLLVDRDTSEYPEVGERVYVLSRSTYEKLDDHLWDVAEQIDLLTDGSAD